MPSPITSFPNSAAKASWYWGILMLITIPIYAQQSALQEAVERRMVDTLLLEVGRAQDDIQSRLSKIYHIRQKSINCEYDSGLIITWYLEGKLCFSHELYEKALPYLLKVDSAIKIAPIESIKAEVKADLGEIYLAIGKNHHAKPYIEAALEIYAQQHDHSNIVAQLNNLGLYYIGVQDYESAILRLNEALTQVAKERQAKIKTHIYNNLATANFYLGETDLALENAHKSLVLADSFGQSEAISDICLLLSEIYTKQGNYQMANELLQKFIATDELIDLKRDQNKVFKIESFIESNSKEKIINKLEEQNDKVKSDKDKIFNIFFLIFISSIFIIIVIYRNSIIQKKNNKVLNQKNTLITKQQQEILEKSKELELTNKIITESKKEIDQKNRDLEKTNVFLESKIRRRTRKLSQANRDLKLANEELELLTYRISHDFKGPLATIGGLTQLIGYHQSDENAKGLLKKIDRTTQLMNKMLDSLIENHLVNSLIPDTAAFIDLKLLINDLKSYFDQEPETEEIAWSDQGFTGFIQGIDGKILKIILKDIINNAIMFTRENSQEKKVQVTFQSTDDTLEFIIWDNGIGIPKEIRHKVYDMFFRGTPQSKGNGLGLYIASKAVDKLGGKLNLESKEQSYTQARLVFPLKSAVIAYHKTSK